MVPVKAGEYVLLVCPVMEVPPEAAVYHRYCPFVPPAAVRVNAPVVQEELPVVVGAVGNGLIPITALLVYSSIALGAEILQR